jgi:hypothetical protein
MANVRLRTRSLTKRSLSKDKQSRMEDRVLGTWGWRSAVEDTTPSSIDEVQARGGRLPRGTILTWTKS